MKRILKLGLIQPKCVPGDVAANLREAEALCRKAAADGAQLLCLPEMCNTGYHLGQLGQKTVTLAIEHYEATVTTFSRVARETGTWLVAPAGEPSECAGIIYNAALVFDSRGELVERYAKAHLWALEKEHFKDGNRLVTFDTPFGRVGLLICYDIGFPEAARALCLQGAELLLVPAAWCIQDKDMWDLNLPQRALENIMLVAGVNSVLDTPDLRLFGHSKVCNPRGGIIAEMDEAPGYAVVELDMDSVREYRSRIPYLRDRKPFLYENLAERR